MTDALTALYDLQAHLKGITPEAGYQSRVMAVYTGISATVTGSQDDLPVLSITTLWDDPEGTEEIETGISGTLQHWRRHAEIEGFAYVATDGQWEPVLDALINDIHRSLVRYRRPLRVGRVTYTPPADNGGNVASFVMALSLPYSLEYVIDF